MTIIHHGLIRYRLRHEPNSGQRHCQLSLLKQQICRQLPQVPRLNDAAGALNISSRSLQRFLQSNNTCFRQLVSECRHQLAQQYLQENILNIQQIATQLGFEEQSSFQKAFKSWQGCSPGVYRQRSNTTISRSYPGNTLASRQVMYGTN
ncbi:helix-turn-helix transcriptional regulator [Arsukibacterium sp.]|uniref:helix-turn-helix transcriptional regulator n=1 Tax=Arsukibacterium sp. TaxID=1977258 RepID=UPI003565535C